MVLWERWRLVGLRRLPRHPGQQRPARVVALGGLAGGDALGALGAGEHGGLVVAGLQAHGAGVVAGRPATGAVGGPLALEAHHHGLAVAHPGQALEEAHGTGVAAEEVAGEEEFDGQHRRAGRDEDTLVAGGRAREQVAIHLEGRQQIGQQHHRPQEGEAHRQGHRHQPPAPVVAECPAVRQARRQGFPLPQAGLAGGAPHQPVDGLHHREMGAQPAAIEPAPAPGHDQERRPGAEDGQEDAQPDVGPQLAQADPSGRVVVQPDMPFPAQEPRMAGHQVVAQQVEDRRQDEEDEKGGLGEEAQALAATVRCGRLSHGRGARSGERRRADRPGPGPGPRRRSRSGWCGRW